jgi:hypothetical protein
MSSNSSVTASVEVAADPAIAFAVFTQTARTAAMAGEKVA